MATVFWDSEMAQTAQIKEQLCVLIDHRTSSAQLVLSYQDVMPLLVCIKSFLPTKTAEKDILEGHKCWQDIF